MIDKVEKIWMDGKLIPWDEANVHILTHTLHYGLGVFEGVRCYKRDDGSSAIFRLDEHSQRLCDSAKIATIPLPWTAKQISEACVQTVRANKLDACYIRPLVFMGDGAMGLAASDNATRMAVIAWRWGAYLGDEALKYGIRAKISSFARPGVNMLMAKGKIVGHYVSSILAKREALNAGYEEAILLDAQGYIAEASGENVFVVKDGTIYTPPLGGSQLGGITRDTVLQLCADLSIPVLERSLCRDELYIADEVFLCGTAAEVTPVRELDDRSIGIGSRGPITEKVQSRFFETLRSSDPSHPEWFTIV
ncbi:MAG: branched-chain amino acid transaminase [Myxococcales bacterium]|nr:MAG: branched-chain amino acid transaminase [Myxococcales bacterium]